MSKEDNKKPVLIDADRFQHFMEMLPIVKGAKNPVIPDDFEPEDKIIYSISANKPTSPPYVKKFKEWVYERWQVLKDEFGRDEGFDKLLKELKAKEINIEDFPGYDMKKFDDRYRQSRSRESNKKLDK